MKNIIIISFFLIELLWSQNSAYKNFQSYMNVDGGVLLDINFYIKQSKNYTESNGLFYYFGDMHYSFDIEDQRITHDNGVITTINKNTKQIIYDLRTENSTSILNILSGEKKGIELGDIILEKNNYKIPFILDELDVRGVLWVLASTGEPKKITLESYDDMKIKIEINPLEVGHMKQIPFIDTSEYEKIDLRD